MRIELSEKDMYTRGGVLDSLLASTYDSILMVDKDGNIVHHSSNSPSINRLTDECIGKHYKEVNPHALLHLVLKSGKAHLGIIDVVDGRKCLVNIYPIYSNQKMIGALATRLFSNLSALKQIFARIKESCPDDNGDIYNTIARIGTSVTFEDFIGKSSAAKDLIFQCRCAAASNRSILLIGETGTGKEILANAIHSESMGDSWKPFIKLNCSAIPKDLLESELFGYEKGAFTGANTKKIGKFELASGGSILLDEIGDMDILMQSKLLRVLEEKEFERLGGTKMIPMTSRIIASTNSDLRDKCRQNTFRPDLYYRLSAIEIKVPPLRQRKDDIPIIITNLMKRDQLNFTIEPDALRIFHEYEWPGNVRELRNIINRIGIYFNEAMVTAKDVYNFLRDSLEYESTQKVDLPLITKDANTINPAEMEKQWLIKHLESCNYNVAVTSKQLGLCRATIYNKIKKYGIVLGKQFPQ